MKVKVEKDTCIGCGACTTIARDVFTIGEDGYAEVTEEYRDKEIPEDKQEEVETAKDSCPTSAIETE